MGKCFFLFVGGPLAGLIAVVPRGRKIFYAMNLWQGLIILILFFSSWERIFTMAQDFWACVETSVSIFVVLELDDRILPMLKEDIKHKCRRSLLKRSIRPGGSAAREEQERAAETTITAGNAFAL